MLRTTAALAVAIVLTACSGSASPPPSPSASASATGLAAGLVAYAADAGIGVLDPSTGKSDIIAPLQPGAFRVSGPVWAPAPGLAYPVIYFTVHDDRPPETRTSTPGVVPYDWIFRVDPFTGVIDPIAASQDSLSEGPLGLVANSHYVAVTTGCCSSYEVDALDVSQPLAPLKVLARPPAQAAFFTEGAAPGSSGLVAVREFGTGTWYWLNADAGVLNPFPVTLGPDDGPVAFTADGALAAVALPDHGAEIESISTALPVAQASPQGSASPAAGASPQKTTPSPSIAPHRVNSKLPHPDGLAFSPDGKQLMIAFNGVLELYRTSAADGAPALQRYLTGANVTGVAWSGAIAGKTFAALKPTAGPQAAVDALLAATRLPQAADTPANRPFTKVYLWQFDSSKPSPLDSITDATAGVLAKYPPLDAGVVFHHWAASDTWGLVGGCYRYRVVITGSIPPVASTIGLPSSAPCSAKLTTPQP